MKIQVPRGPAPAAREPTQSRVSATRGFGPGFDAPSAPSEGEVPFRGRMELAFGQDFSGVKARLGRADEMDRLGAAAVAREEEVTFASPSPDPVTVAHEMAHVVQKRFFRSAPQRRLSARDDPAEIEARSVAPDAAAGRPVEIAAAPSAEIHRITSDELDQLVGELPAPVRSQARSAFLSSLGSGGLGGISLDAARETLGKLAGASGSRGATPFSFPSPPSTGLPAISDPPSRRSAFSPYRPAPAPAPSPPPSSPPFLFPSLPPLSQSPAVSLWPSLPSMSGPPPGPPPSLAHSLFSSPPAPSPSLFSMPFSPPPAYLLPSPSFPPSPLAPRPSPPSLSGPPPSLAHSLFSSPPAPSPWPFSMPFSPPPSFLPPPVSSLPPPGPPPAPIPAPGKTIRKGAVKRRAKRSAPIGPSAASSPDVPDPSYDLSREGLFDPTHVKFSKGGLHGQTKKISKKKRRESEHMLPKQVWKGTPFARSQDRMPALSIDYDDHRRGQSGAGGGVTSTGSSGVAKDWRKRLHASIVSGDTFGAIRDVVLDELNSSPVRGQNINGILDAIDEYTGIIGTNGKPMLTEEQAGQLKELAASVHWHEAERSSKSSGGPPSGGPPPPSPPPSGSASS